MDHADRHRRQRYGYMPWTEMPEVVAAEQPSWQSFLRHEYDVALGDDVFIAPDAMVWLPDGRIGDRTWLASHAVVRGDVSIGADCSINPYATVAGDVTIGDHVRIAPLASVWGFNHGFDDPDAPIHEQESTYEGVEIGDDVWIGANAVILDGVTVGDHSVVGAAAVVTDDIAPYRVVGGNPAQVIRDRRADGRSGAADRSAEAVGDDFPAALASFGERAAEQLDSMLERYRDDDTYLDRPGADRTVRAPCDAIEVAGMFDAIPAGRSRDAWVSWLRGLQDPETGLFPDPDGSPDPDADPRELPRAWDRYHILAVGYALEVLGAAPDHRISAVDALTPDALYDRLDGLPWDDHAWRCGDWIDCYGTALYFNRRYFDGRRAPASVFGWLETNVDPDSGLWGEPTTDQGWLQPVNGFYRLTRGTYAQFGIDVPAPERAIDTVLGHARESPVFQDERLNACNVLDVIHPLWLCGKQTTYRQDEARQWARDRLPVVLDAWQEDQGFGFRLAGDDPSLQGTEMWLSIVYLLADVCGWANALGYRPRGVHRTDVPLELRRT